MARTIPPQRILVLHNRYTQRGGEDSVVDAEVAALRERGHTVDLLEVENADASGHGVGERIRDAREAVWSEHSADLVRERVRAFEPTIAHVHNHAYALSASIFPALHAAGVPVVATLHNYRMTCSNAYLLRDGKPCELCVGRTTSVPGIRHKCFRNSTAASAMVAAMQRRYRRSAMPAIDRWIVLTDFARNIFERAGFPADRLTVRPNTVADQGAGPAGQRAPHLLFVGRLDESKGVHTLLKAWRDVTPRTGARLTFAGDGPLAPVVQAVADTTDTVEYAGRVGAPRVHELMRSARALVAPSHWYEGFPMVVLEAFAAGTPVIASDLGSLAEIVTHLVGWRTPAAEAPALTAALQHALDTPEDATARGRAARRAFESQYSQSIVMEQLETIYASVVRPDRPER